MAFVREHLDRLAEIISTDKELKDKNIPSPALYSMIKMSYLQDFYLAVKNPRPGAGIVESIFGPCIYRDNEDTRSYNMYKNVLHDYLANDINKCFHLSIEEYLQLTPYEKLMMDEVAEEYNKQVREAMEKAQKEGEQSAVNKWSKASKGQGMGLGDLDGLI